MPSRNKISKVMLRTLISASIAAIISSNAYAIDTSGDDEITIYQNNMALIRDVRSVSVEEGVQTLEFDNVSDHMISDSAFLNKTDLATMERNYSYNLIDFDNIVRGLVGQEINLNGSPNYKLVSYVGGIAVVQSTINEQYSSLKRENLIENLKIDKIPSDLKPSPSLSMKVRSSVENKKENLELTYLTNNITWYASYIINLSSEETGNLDAWVTIKNNTELSMQNAKIRLTSGEVNKASQPQPIYARKMALNLAESFDAPSSTQENLGDHKLYSLPYTYNILAKQQKQMSLFQVNDIKLDKKYAIELDLNQDVKNKNPSIEYTFINDQTYGMGRDIPKGIVRFYQTDSHGNTQFIGENFIPTLNKGQRHTMRIGATQDISISTMHQSEWIDRLTHNSGKINIVNSSDDNRTVNLILTPLYSQSKKKQQPLCVTDFKTGKSRSMVDFILPSGVELKRISAHKNNACNFEFDVKSDSNHDVVYSISL